MLLHDRNSEEEETTSVKRSTEKALQTGVWSWMLGNELRDEQKDKMMTCIWGRWAMVTKEEKWKCTGLFRRQWQNKSTEPKTVLQILWSPSRKRIKVLWPCSPYYVAISFLLHRKKRKKEYFFRVQFHLPSSLWKGRCKERAKNCPISVTWKARSSDFCLDGKVISTGNWGFTPSMSRHYPLQRRYRKGPIMEA